MAESWDPIGLQTGSMNTETEAVLLCLDITSAAVARARAERANLIITHHPLIFSPLQTVRADLPEQQLLYNLISHQISVFSAHTNLDAAPGGVADCLAQSLELESDACKTVFPINEAIKGYTNAGQGRYTDSIHPIKFVIA